MRELEGKNVVLCVTGSVAAVKSFDIARSLVKGGANVAVALTSAALQFVGVRALEWATGKKPVTTVTGRAEHIELSSKADLILIAPATARTISKLAHGVADNCVTLTALAAMGRKVPLLIAPAMHRSLYESPPIKECIGKLEKLGVEFVEPRLEEDKAKLATVERIVQKVAEILAGGGDMTSLRILVTAGPTRAYLDPIRIITNRSSGKMGIAIAAEALARGAEVTIVYGPGSALPPPGAKVIRVETTEQMHEAVRSELEGEPYDVAILAAAPLDYAPAEPSPIKLSGCEVSLVLRELPKVHEAVREARPDIFLVGFKAEFSISDERLVSAAKRKLVEAQMDIVVANDVAREGVGFEVDTNEVFIVTRSGRVVHVPRASKREIARRVLDVVLEEMKKR